MEIQKMETNEIIHYLTKERYLHGLFFINRDQIESEIGLSIPKDDWLKFVNFYTHVFNEYIINFTESDEYYDLFTDWVKDPYMYGTKIIDEASLFHS